MEMLILFLNIDDCNRSPQDMARIQKFNFNALTGTKAPVIRHGLELRQAIDGLEGAIKRNRKITFPAALSLFALSAFLVRFLEMGTIQEHDFQ